MADASRDSRSFRTDALSGGRWGAIRSVALQVSTILTTAVLARLLSDTDFGLVAITVVVLTMFDLITRVGLGASVVRREPLTKEFSSTFFWASLILGLVAGGLAALIAVPGARLAGNVDAAPLVVLSAATLPFNLMARVPSGLLSREFRFRTLAMIDISGAFVHGIVAISLAFAGFGAWSVVIGQVVRSLVMLVASVLATRFRPDFTMNFGFLREELSFNASWLSADLISYANKNADYWFVGNRLGTGALGVYYVAYVIPNLLRRRITQVGHDVIYPVVSRIAEDTKRIRSVYREVLCLVSFLAVPMMLGLAAVADLTILIGFGPDWTEAIDPLRIVAVSAAITAVTVVGQPIFAAMGHPQVLIPIGIIQLVILGVGLSFSFNDGSLVAVSLAVLLATSVRFFLVVRKLKQMIGVSYRAFVVAVMPYVVASLIMVSAVWALRSTVFEPLSVVPEAIVAVGVGALLYLGSGFLFFRRSFSEQIVAVRALLIPSRKKA